MVDNRTIAPGGFDYQRLRDNTAETLLARFGKTAILHVPAPPPADPFDPPGPGTDYSITVVGPNFNLDNRERTLIQDATLKLLVSTDGITVAPALGQTVTVGDDIYIPVSIEPLDPGDTDMMYTVYCKR